MAAAAALLAGVLPTAEEGGQIPSPLAAEGKRTLATVSPGRNYDQSIGAACNLKPSQRHSCKEFKIFHQTKFNLGVSRITSPLKAQVAPHLCDLSRNARFHEKDRQPLEFRQSIGRFGRICRLEIFITRKAVAIL
jgi:hypothetical protein